MISVKEELYNPIIVVILRCGPFQVSALQNRYLWNWTWLTCSLLNLTVRQIQHMKQNKLRNSALMLTFNWMVNCRMTSIFMQGTHRLYRNPIIYYPDYLNKIRLELLLRLFHRFDQLCPTTVSQVSSGSDLHKKNCKFMYFMRVSSSFQFNSSHLFVSVTLMCS